MVKKAKSKNRVELRTFSNGWAIDLCRGTRCATVTQPQRIYRDKRSARQAAGIWSKATGWPIVEE